MIKSFTSVLYISMVIIILIPFAVIFLWAFSRSWFYPDILPSEFSFRVWKYIFGVAGPQIFSALIGSFKVSVLTAIISVIIGIPAGRALGLYEFYGKGVISVLLILPVVVPPLCVSMGLHLWFLRLGLTDSTAGVVTIHLTFCLPYAVFVMKGVFSAYNPEFEEQARSLGASRSGVVFYIMIPLILPGVAVATLFSFLLSWSQYLSTLIIGGGEVTTLPVLLFAIIDSGDRPAAAAVSIIFVLPALLALYMSTRFLNRREVTGIW